MWPDSLMYIYSPLPGMNSAVRKKTSGLRSWDLTSLWRTNRFVSCHQLLSFCHMRSTIAIKNTKRHQMSPMIGCCVHKHHLFVNMIYSCGSQLKITKHAQNRPSLTIFNLKKRHQNNLTSRCILNTTVPPLLY